MLKRLLLEQVPVSAVRDALGLRPTIAFLEQKIQHVTQNAAWHGGFEIWRRKRDSNPRASCPANGFQDRRLRPLGHSSTSKLADLPVPRNGRHGPGVLS